MLEQQSPGRLDHPAWCVVDDHRWQFGTGICGSDLCGLYPGRLKSEATLWPLQQWRCQSPSDILGGDEQQLSTHYINNTHTRLMALCLGLPRWAGIRKVKTNLNFTEARDSEWQWHQLGHMQICTSLQTNNHASTPPLSFLQAESLPAAQPTASKHWRNSITLQKQTSQVVFWSKFHFQNYSYNKKLCIAKCTVSLDSKVWYQQSSLSKSYDFSYKNVYSHSLCESFRDPLVETRHLFFWDPPLC